MNIVKKIIKWIRFKLQVGLKRGFCEFHHFPFDAMQPLTNYAYETMADACNILDRIGVKYRLTDGTALGLYRQGEFIKHDNDIDVDIFEVDQNDIKLLINNFIANGYLIGRVAVYNGQVQQVIFYDENNVIFDIVIWYQNNKLYVNNSEKGYVRTQEAKYFQSLTEWQYNGFRYQMPGFLEEWMVMRYGPDWKIPKTYKGDWKDDCFDIKKIVEEG